MPFLHACSLSGCHQRNIFHHRSIGASYIYNKKKLKATDVGYESAIDYEKVLQLNPDVVFAYSIQGQTAEYLDKIRQLGLTVVEMTEHLENHPLGKAEFIVAFAAFFNKEEMAAEIFTGIHRAYTDFCTLAQQAVSASAPEKRGPAPQSSDQRSV